MLPIEFTEHCCSWQLGIGCQAEWDDWDPVNVTIPWPSLQKWLGVCVVTAKNDFYYETINREETDHRTIYT